MPRFHFSLAGLFLWVTFCALVLAFFVPIVQSFGHLDESIVSLAISADGSTVAALWSSGTLRLWDARTGIEITKPNGADFFHGNVALSSDSGRMAVASESAATSPPVAPAIGIWDVRQNRKLATINTPFHEALALGPIQPIIAVTDGSSVELHRWDTPQPVPPELVASAYLSVSELEFSADGKLLAFGANPMGVVVGGKYQPAPPSVVLYDVEREKVRTEFQSTPGTIAHMCLSFSPDGRSLAILENSNDGTGQAHTLLDVRDVETGEVIAKLPVANDDAATSIAFLTDGRTLVVADEKLTVWDVPTQTRRNFSHSAGHWVQYVRAARGGNLFVTAGFDAIILWDGTSLAPVRTLWRGWSEPPFLVWVGFAVWFFIWLMLRARKLRLPCRACGNLYLRAGKKDKSVDCPTCRQKNMTVAEQKRENRTNLRKLLPLWLPVLAIVALPMAAGIESWMPVAFWPALLLSILFLALALPLLAIGAILLVYFVIRRRYADERRDLALAEHSAGEQGIVRRYGAVTAWWAPTTTLADTFETELPLACERLAAALGRTIEISRQLRVIGFEHRADYDRYRRAHDLFQPDRSQATIYRPGTPCRALVCEELMRESGVDMAIQLRPLVLSHFVSSCSHGRLRPWLSVGLVYHLSRDEQPGHSAMLNRGPLAAMARGALVPWEPWFLGTPTKLWWKHGAGDTLKSFSFWHLFNWQSISLVEFLIGGGAPPQRKAAFGPLFDDPELHRIPEQAFERHYGIPLERMLVEWRLWIESRGAGSHEPPPAPLCDASRRGALATLASGEATLQDRIAAIRGLGGGGYPLGADELITIVREGPDELREEAVWALETISGHAWGRDVNRWEQWWNKLPAEVK
ncbi:MAG TPA: hypothetical protein VND64_06305 [Pirellulales bacterium]|nr:hypothetical protein [Pirellulales bacterium]